MKREYVGFLYYLLEWEDRVVLITDKELDEIINVVGYDCEKEENFVVCNVLNHSMLNALGKILEHELREFHGKKVRIVVETIE